MEMQWKSDLQPLLAPGTIAIVGATEKSGPARNTIRSLLDIGFEGKILPVHPKNETVLGLPCYPSLRELPEKPDLAVMAIRADRIKPMLLECEELGIHAATVYSSGFREISAEGAAMQEEITEIAERAKIRLCGPNCLGHLNVGGRVGAYSGSILKGTKPGNVAVLSQSGSMVISMYQAFLHLGLSHVVSYGNQAVLDLSDYILYLANDPGTKVIAAFIEGLQDGRKFLRAVEECRKNGKAVVALKVGKSEIGSKIAMAHTAALAGSKKVFEEALRVGNVLEVGDLDEMLQTVTALIKTPQVKKPGVAVLAISGGQCSLVGDISEEIGLELAKLSEETKQKIEAIVPSFVHVRNPLDVALVGEADYREYKEVLARVVEDENIGLTAVMQDAPLAAGESTISHYSNIVRAVVETAEETGNPILVYANHSTPCEPRIMQPVLDAGLPLLQGTRASLSAIRNLMWYYMAADSSEDGVSCEGVDWHAIRETLLAYRKEKKYLSEKEGKELLARLGVPVTKDVLCISEEELLEQLHSMQGEVVLKIDSPDILHKTDVGGVALHLAGAEAVSEAYRDMLRNVAACAPNARINGVVLQEMAPDGVDVIVGANQDVQFGPVIVFGLGGIYVEVFRDISIGLVPLTRAKARQIIRESGSYALFGEVRGRAAFNLEPLVDTLMAISALMEHCGDLISEVDLNPVRVGTFGVKVLDTLIGLEREESGK